MRRHSMLVPERAVEDLRIARFPLLEMADTPTQDEALIPIDHPPFVREGLLPASLFRPMAFDLTDVSPAAMEANRVWTGNGHVRAVVKGHLGPHGARLGSRIIQELVLHSGHNRSASCAVTTVRIALNTEVGDYMFASVWDDGDEYESTWDMQATLEEDEWGILGADPGDRKPLPEDTPPFVTDAVRTATQGFEGTVRLLSGDMGVAVRYDGEREKFEFERYASPQISGNLVVVELPSSCAARSTKAAV